MCFVFRDRKAKQKEERKTNCWVIKGKRKPENEGRELNLNILQILSLHSPNNATLRNAGFR